jgi:hypothetical protein
MTAHLARRGLQAIVMMYVLLASSVNNSEMQMLLLINSALHLIMFGWLNQEGYVGRVARMENQEMQWH